MAGTINGLTELRAELRAAADATPREISKALKAGAVKVTARAMANVPAGGTGAMAATGKPFATQKKAGVRFTHPGAGVEEFATQYTRRNRGGDGRNTVTISKGPSPPRFAYKAINELGPALVEEGWAAMIELAKLHGWFLER